LSGTWHNNSPNKGIYTLPANLNKSFYYSLIKHLLHQVEHHHQELTCYKKIKFVLSMTHSNGYRCFAHYCISILEHGNLPTELLIKGFQEWCLSEYGTVDGGQKDCSQSNTGKVEQMICTWQGVVWVSCISGVSPVVPHKKVDYCKDTLISQEPHPSYWWADSQWVGSSSALVQTSIHEEVCYWNSYRACVITKSVKDEWLEAKARMPQSRLLSMMQDWTMDCDSLEQSSLLATRPLTRKSLTFTSRTRLTPFFPLWRVAVAK
jgi:hypothetical protein